MKKKKILLALIVIAIVASIGALGYLALSYFGSSARSSNAGGKPDSAMGGGTNALKLDDALAAVDDFVAEHLK